MPPADVFADSFPAARGRRLVLFVGRISWLKNLDLLIRAMGDVVSVTNPQSKRVLQGKVSGAGRVSVQPSAAGRVASAQ